ncbi:MAG TPA: hypothetical protein GXX75_16160 [Clostridiales bacterium]|nr:hypothetical protein [Clostridiales bacterium]
MGRNRKLFSAILFLSLSLFMGNAMYASAEEEKTICQGVVIDEVDVSGMTRAQAEEAVKGFVDTLRAKGIAVRVHDNTVYATLGDLGYTSDYSGIVEEALDLGQSGNLIKRYKDLKDIEQGSYTYSLEFTYDEEKIRELVSKEISSYNIEPVNASVKRESGDFVYTDHVIGSKVNVDKTVKLIEDAINNWDRQDILVDAVVDEDMPKYTMEDVKKCNTLLGSYTTEYTTSAQGRAANLANGARLINNTVLYPGDVFNSYDKLTPFTKENGYFTAGAYLNGMVVDSVGGGACQVTTTLYNAVLEAELEVVERFPHSMTIAYVDLSRDAAIAGTYKNFQFKNNTDAPIVVEATTWDRRITFKLWGHETRDENRKIKYVTEILSKTNPPADVIKKDPTQPTTFRQVTQTAHIGYKAKLWKIVYENGKEVSREVVNTSNYAAAPQYVTVGTKEPEEETDPDTPPTGDPKNPTKTPTKAPTKTPTKAPTDDSGTDDSGDDNSEADNPGWDYTEIEE